MKSVIRCLSERKISLLSAIPILFIAIILVSSASFLLSNFVYEQNLSRSEYIDLGRNGYIDVRLGLEAAGYKETGNFYSFNKTDTGVDITIRFDFERGYINKNKYRFDFGPNYMRQGSTYYVSADILGPIVNHIFEYDGNEWQASPVQFDQHEWTTAFAPLVAHGGGTVREALGNTDCTNSMESLIQNYSLGHRVFEIDFRATSDGKLAAAHGWGGYEEGYIPTVEEFLVTGPANNAHYTALLVDDVLDEMIVNRDMFLVTDTKDRDITAFEIIYDEAVNRDPTLLDRIIPQVYNRAMYDTVMSIYEFPSIIFTLYATAETNEDVVAFAAQHDNIAVLTTWGYGDRIEQGLVELARENELLVYAHTQNHFEDFAGLFSSGVSGIYTDSLTPLDYEIYLSYGGLRSAASPGTG